MGWHLGKLTSSSGSGVQSVTGLNTDNTDPQNPVVKISVDGISIQGEGTPVNPLSTGNTINKGLYAQTDISQIITNTTTETSLIGTGEGILTVPAFTFVNGDSFVATMGGEISNLNNTNITIRIKSGIISLVDTGLIQLKQGLNQFYQITIYFTIRTIGGVGVASIISNGNFTHIRNNTGVEVFGFNTLNNTTFNTEIANTLDITAQWQTASTSNSIHSDYFTLNKMY